MTIRDSRYSSPVTGLSEAGIALQSEQRAYLKLKDQQRVRLFYGLNIAAL
jgi:hypothetical protein